MKKNSTEHQELSIAQQNAELRIIGRKICTKCRIEKAASEFYACKAKGIQSWCKQCKREAKRKTKSGFLSDLAPIGKAICSTCLKIKPLNESNFFRSKIKENSKVLVCKPCRKNKSKCYRLDNLDAQRVRHKKWRFKNNGHVRHTSKMRKKSVKIATPLWFEYEMVKKVYEMASFYGFDVDHIVPINSGIVCGLHCHANLQLLHKSINSSKKNRYWPDMP